MNGNTLSELRWWHTRDYEETRRLRQAAERCVTEADGDINVTSDLLRDFVVDDCRENGGVHHTCQRWPEHRIGFELECFEICCPTADEVESMPETDWRQVLWFLLLPVSHRLKQPLWEPELEHANPTP